MATTRIPDALLMEWAIAAVIANGAQRKLKKAPTRKEIEDAARLTMSQAGFRSVAEAAYLAGRANAAPPSSKPLPKVRRSPDEQPLPGFDTVTLAGGPPPADAA